jgi:hypothetical protein
MALIETKRNWLMLQNMKFLDANPSFSSRILNIRVAIEIN